MNGSIVRQLIAKDLFLLRPMMIGALVFGGIGIGLMAMGETQFFVGWIILFIAATLLGIFTTAVAVITERKDRVHLFVLTLPVSPAQYLRAKLAASAIAFFVPWAILLAAALALIGLTGIPDGLMSFLTMLLGYVVCYYAAYLGVSLVTDSAILSIVVIIVGNTAPVFLIPQFLQMSGIGVDFVPPDASWTGAVLGTLAGEIAFSAAVFGLALFIRSRQRDLI
jgi:ABC-type transport system involved in multi-copper enzyme maturation permease subunit